MVWQPALLKGIFPGISQVKARVPLTPQQLEAAEQVYVRAHASRCPHGVGHPRKACILELAQEMRRKGFI